MIYYPFDLKRLPRNGIYFFYEKGEIWGHNGNKLRIVRIGTHKKHNFRSRIAEHFLFNSNKMNFTTEKSKPSDRSIFRKQIVRAILNRTNDPYLNTWEIDFTTRKNKDQSRNMRNIEKETEIESEITKILRETFSFRFILCEDEKMRIGSAGLESRLIGTLAKCPACAPSEIWLGHYSPKKEIRDSGLWLIQYLSSNELSEIDQNYIETAIMETQNWWGG